MGKGDSFLCPHCDAIVPARARACPECGSDERTGWARDPVADGLAGPAEEAPVPGRVGSGWLRYVTAGIAVLLVAALVLQATPWAVWLLPLVLAGLAGLFYRGRSTAGKAPDREQELYSSLLEKAQGDTELVARLIEHERRRSPSASSAELLKDAHYRWDRDRR